MRHLFLFISIFFTNEKIFSLYGIIHKESIRFKAGKKSSSEKIRTALNVILSNCTQSRKFSHDIYGKSIFSFW